MTSGSSTWNAFSIPNADMAFNSFGFLMHKPYGMLLWSWLARQRWVEDAEGMSAAELYTLICLQTGWVSPRNITRIPESERPPGLRTGLSASARVWTHELAWPALALTRESFSAQISTFRVVMAALFKQQGISWSFQPAAPFSTPSGYLQPLCEACFLLGWFCNSVYATTPTWFILVQFSGKGIHCPDCSSAGSLCRTGCCCCLSRVEGLFALSHSASADRGMLDVKVLKSRASEP